MTVQHTNSAKIPSLISLTSRRALARASKSVCNSINANNYLAYNKNNFNFFAFGDQIGSRDVIIHLFNLLIIESEYNTEQRTKYRDKIR